MQRFLRPRKDKTITTRHAPTAEEVVAEAAAFRAESEGLRRELADLRTEISSTMDGLSDFTTALRGTP